MRAVLALALTLGLTACGGVEPLDETRTGEPQDTSESPAALAGACESLIGTFCRPGTFDISCTWNDGAEGNCYCQYPPFNKWVCDYNG
ncbi:hypothetical protein LZ198_10040 [Myxococcus sp. K15C18031901]|uniref:hypothetical protein n=1 Tax=Myxococcus dinghuensis TaxID=2906761 RepID=UPI0020A7CB49|nr:hypothetical protein [Myxococcus dinghuensis]MCP3099209.1 hypothetical protein [Myxococcus dinghuensis]